MDYFSALKRKISLTAELLEATENVEEIEANLAKIENFFLELNKPNNFIPDDPTNAIINLEMSYENLCSLLVMNGVADIKTLSIFEFYSRLRYYKNSNTPKK